MFGRKLHRYFLAWTKRTLFILSHFSKNFSFLALE